MSEKMTQLIVIGATAFPEIHEIIHDINSIFPKYKILGILDDNNSLKGTQIEGCPVLGNLDTAQFYQAKAKFVFGIGSHKTRLKRHELLKRLNIPESQYETLIHPLAKIYRSATIGHGVIVHAGSVVFNDSQIGSYCVITGNSIVGARNVIGRGCLIASLVSLTSDVKIGSYSFIGTHSSVAEGVKIGPGSMVGMRTFVTRNISSGSVVFGDPMKLINKEVVPKSLVEDWERKKNEREY